MRKGSYVLCGICLILSQAVSAGGIIKFNPLFSGMGIQSYGFDYLLDKRSALTLMYTTIKTKLIFIDLDMDIATVTYKKMFSNDLGDGAYWRLGAGVFGGGTVTGRQYTLMPAAAIGVDTRLGKHFVLTYELGSEISLFSLGYRF